jgi:hypothetical protein
MIWRKNYQKVSGGLSWPIENLWMDQRNNQTIGNMSAAGCSERRRREI